MARLKGKNLSRSTIAIPPAGIDYLNKQVEGLGDAISQLASHLGNRADAQAGHGGTVGIAKQVAKDSSGKLIDGLTLNEGTIGGVSDAVRNDQAINLAQLRRYFTCDHFGGHPSGFPGWFEDCVGIQTAPGDDSDECESPGLEGPPPTTMSFLFGGENGFAPGDGYLYTGNQVQARIEIVEYFGLPTQTPAEIGQFDFPGGFKMMRVAVWGTTMYVANSEGGIGHIEILDVSDRTNPQLKPRFVHHEPAALIAFAQGRDLCGGCRPLLATSTGGTFHLLDISDPEDPDLLDSFTHLLGEPVGINVSRRGTAFVIGGNNPANRKLLALDISNPSDIKEFSRINLPTGGLSFRSFYQSWGFPGYIYMSHSPSQNIHIYDVRNPREMSLVSSAVVSNGVPQSFSVEGTALFVLTSKTGQRSQLEVYDITDPTAPDLMTSAEMPTLGFYSWGLLTRDGAYVAHDPTTGQPTLAWFSIEFPPCCNCNPFLVITGTN